MRTRLSVALAVLVIMTVPAMAEETALLHAAGSLRAALTEVAKDFEAASLGKVQAKFGASGLLKDEIATGAKAEVFASANMEHPQALAAEKRSGPAALFARNRLCALARPGLAVAPASLLDRMLDPQLKLGTSTPKADPSGDYAWEGPNAPDILSDLFGGYSSSDLIIAGASLEAVARLRDSSNEDLEGRFTDVAAAWTMAQFTGYGEAVRIAARDLYEIEVLSEATIRAGQQRLKALQRQGGCIAILRDHAKVDHVQTDQGLDVIDLPRSSVEFFLRDLSLRRFAFGAIDDPVIEEATGVTVRNLATLEQAMEALFARCAPLSIAVKSQHAYVRTLAWQQRTDAEAERAVQVVREGGPGSDDPQSEARLCLGD